MSAKTVIAWGIVLLAAGGSYLVQRTYGKPVPEHGHGHAPAAGATTHPVTVAPAAVAPVAGTITYTGTVAADVEEDIYPRVTGRIVKMDVYPGDRVEPGQIVARLDDVELGLKVREVAAAVAAAEASLAQMDADVTAARHNVVQMERELAMAEAESGYQQRVAARDEQLLAKGAIPEQEAENSRAMAAAARARVEAARARLEQAKAMERSALKKRETMAAMVAQHQAMLQAAEVVRDYVNIRAASDGYVAKRLIAPGTLVQPGMPILKIAQIDRVRFQANVTARDVGRLRVGTRVRVWVPGGEQRPLALKVTSIFPFVEGTSRTAIVEGLAENPGRRFLPGQYATMEFEVDTVGDAVSVPRAAVVRRGGRDAVWLVAEGVAASREIATGPANAARVAVLRGLRPGELVVVKGHEGLYEGAKVATEGRPSGSGEKTAGVVRQQPAGRHAAGHKTEATIAQAPAPGREAEPLQIKLSTTPATPRVGNTRLRVEVRDQGGMPVSGAKVELRAGMPGHSGPKVAARAAKEPGVYETAVNLSMAGAWTVEVTVARPQGKATSAQFTLEAK